MKTHLRLLTLASAACLVMALGGCGSGEGDTTTKVDIDESGEKVSIQTNDPEQGGVSMSVSEGGVEIQAGEQNMQVKAGENVQLPDDFPEDVPLYDPLQIRLVSSDEEAGAVNLMGIIPDKPAKAGEAYQKAAEAAGWKLQERVSPVAQMVILRLSKGERELVANFAETGAECTLTVSVTPADKG